MPLTSRECKMARAALRLTARQVAERAGLHHNTVHKLEAGDAVSHDTAKALEDFYKGRGIAFPSEDVVDASRVSSRGK